MKVLSNPQLIGKEFKRLLKNYSKYSWAVAWGSTSYKDGFRLLTKNSNKIKMLIVGIHFYQTHPDFISEFIDDQNVRFVMNPEGIYHPKVYLFENKNEDWECIIGSPNFTGSAFTNNSQVSVLLSSDDNNANVAYQDINDVLERYWTKGTYLTADNLKSYRNIWKRKQKSLNQLSGQYGSSKKVKKSPLDVDIFKMSWRAFLQEVKNDQEIGLQERLKVLNTARELFESHNHFNEIDKEVRRGVAGFGPSDVINWHAFGSTKPARKFKGAINSENKYISIALDQIPLHGDITQNHYDSFVKEFNKFDGGGIATGTRLLSMKRPDYFLCFNSKNKDSICKKFDIPKNINLSNYWNIITVRIIDCVWWNSKEPSEQIESAVWNYRAAFLDSLFYDPSK